MGGGSELEAEERGRVARVACSPNARGIGRSFCMAGFVAGFINQQVNNLDRDL
jgi:hypothetical protein